MQFGFNMICFRIFLLTILYFQLGSLSVLQIKILLTTSSYKVWKLLNPMTCQCRYTQGNGWVSIVLYNCGEYMIKAWDEGSSLGISKNYSAKFN